MPGQSGCTGDRLSFLIMQRLMGARNSCYRFHSGEKVLLHEAVQRVRTLLMAAIYRCNLSDNCACSLLTLSDSFKLGVGSVSLRSPYFQLIYLSEPLTKQVRQSQQYIEVYHSVARLLSLRACLPDEVVEGAVHDLVQDGDGAVVLGLVRRAVLALVDDLP